MTIAALLFALLLVALLIGSGAWMALWGGVLVSTAGSVDDDTDRAAMIRIGVAVLLAGMILFFAGAIGAGRMIG